MTRNAMPSFDSFDPDVLEAARDVARRAGVPLETWIASVVPDAAKRNPSPNPSPKPAAVRAQRRRAAASDPAPVDPTPPTSAFEGSAPVPDAPATTPEAAQADPFGATFQALLARIDGLDRTLSEERQAVEEAARRRIEEIEARVGQALGAGAAPVQQVADRLGDIERRMSALGEQVAASRPPGRRGRPAAAEIRDAVQEIRQRQRELDDDAQGSIVATMRQDLARRLDAAVAEAAPPEAALPEAVQPPVPDAVSELRRETSRLRESIGHLATGRDLGALEQAMISLASGVERAHAPADLAAIAAPIELIRVQVERLADDVAENVHARVAGDVERLAARLGTVVAGGHGGTVDHDALTDLFRELEEIRHLIAALAGPERIQGLANGLQAISAQIAQLQAGPETNLRPLLEEIRTGLQAAGPAPAILVDQIEAMAAKLDALQAGARGADAAASKAILGRIDALSDKVDRVSAQPVGDLIGRLEGLGETLGETLRRPAVPGGDVASIHAMLRNLAEKVDRVGARPGGEGLDALEKQVVLLANRIDARSVDPTLVSLERTMGDLLRQVSALREAAPSEAVVAQAARSAVAASIGGAREAADRSEFGLLRAGLADIQARQAASDQRLSVTLEGVQSALDRLVGRLGAPEAGEAARLPIAARQASLEERLLGSTGIEAPRRGARRPELPHASGAAPAPEAARIGDELLEPGAGRPAKDATAKDAPTKDAPARERVARDRTEAPEADAADIKTNFIAAARRAAQAAQAEVASEAALSAGRREPRGSAGRAAPAASAPGAGPVARLRAEIDRRRRPLLLGLAAVVLALGALQAISMRPTGADAARTSLPPAASVPARDASGVADAGTPSAPKADSLKADPAKVDPVPAEVARTVPADPQTTQAIASPPPEPRAAQARAALPQVSGMASLSGDLAGLPAALSKLRQSVLDGDGTAIWELAGREADGRGLPRDLSLAAKLYEKLAAAGYAPAQYKLAGHHEKGSGLVRDIGQAKLWYGRAAEQGHARSMHNLAVLYAENPAASGKPDYASAASWFRQGAEYGVRDSQYNLAVLYARGLGLTQDLMQSYAWFSAAAAQGDEDAGRKRDDVANKLSPADLATARSIAANFKPHRLDRAVNEPPVSKEAAAGPMTLLGAPAPVAPTFAPVARRGV
ncbi:hypothetical protein [uncultured Methylobacterium sp.]|uniref:hypothetical protein n=1 Tax=uncultured Methylobacterium sp. TaxID=157278 RepID=UPI0035CC75C2